METHMAELFSTKILITKEEKKAFRELARSKGMTFSGYLGQLIKRELAYSNAGTPSSSTDQKVFPHEPLGDEGSSNAGRD